MFVRCIPPELGESNGKAAVVARDHPVSPHHLAAPTIGHSLAAHSMRYVHLELRTLAPLSVRAIDEGRINAVAHSRIIIYSSHN